MLAPFRAALLLAPLSKSTKADREDEFVGNLVAYYEFC